MEEQGMMNDNMFDEDYLRWKHAQQHPGTPLEGDAWKYQHPGYELFGEDAWKFDELLKMKESGQLTDEMLDEDFQRYEQWKHSQVPPKPKQPVYTPPQNHFNGMMPGSFSYEQPTTQSQSLFDQEFMQKLATWKALHGGRATYPGYGYQDYNSYPFNNYYGGWNTGPVAYPQNSGPVVNPAYNAPPMTKAQMTAGLNNVLNNQIDVFAEDKKCSNENNIELKVEAGEMRGSIKADNRCSSFYSVTQTGSITCVPSGEECDLVDEAGSVVFYIPNATLAELDQAVEAAENPKRNVNFSPFTGEHIEA